MRSFKFRILEFTLKHFSHRKIFRLGPQELKEYLEKAKGSRTVNVPKFILEKFNVREELIQNRPCFFIEKRENPCRPDGWKKVVLLLHGGGYIFETHKLHWQAAARIAGELGIPVCLPAYPLLPDSTLEESLAMISGSFMRLQKDFPPEAITVLGDSAGANYALSMCHYYKQQGLPMPGKLILLSPAMAGEKDPEILAAMRRQAPYDVMFDMQYFSSYNELKTSVEKDHLTLPMLGDFSSFPDMYIFSGTHESFYPQVLAFSERLKTENIKAEFHFGEGMMHVWPYMPLAKECLETMDTILRIIGS